METENNTIKIEVLFQIGQIIYLKTDIDQAQRLCTGIMIRERGIMYLVGLNGSETYHYGFEMSESINELIKVL